MLAIVAVAAACCPINAGAARPSASACAVAWNRSASHSLRTSIANEKPRGAFIDGGGTTVGTDTWSKGGKSTSTQRVGCGIDFILSSGKILAVSGPWSEAGVQRWTGPVASNRQIPLPNNTSVHADGTVGFHG